MDPYVELAKLSIAHYARHRKTLREIPKAIEDSLCGQRAAVFVSIHTRDGELRGCKGTLEPVHRQICEEIIANAISACARDPRFEPVHASELESLDINVDVLSSLEDIQSPQELDVRRYGVVVSTDDGRRGVLLPDLEGVDTVDQQLRIACRKASIGMREKYAMQRFTVVRHKE